MSGSDGELRWGAPAGRPNPHVDYGVGIMPYHRVVARAVGRHLPDDAAVLDMGCGTGQVLRLLAESGKPLRLSATDIDAVCVTAAGERVDLIDAFTLGPDELRSRSGAYDGLILCHVLEHTDNPGAFLRETMDVLGEGGLAFLAVPNPVRPNNLLNAAVRRHYVNPGHRFAWDRSHWMNFLENIMGLEVVEYLSDHVPLLPLIERIPGVMAVETGLARILPWWSFSNIAVVRRP